MFAEGVEAVAGSDSGAHGLSASLSVDIAQLESTTVVTHEHDRLRPMGAELVKGSGRPEAVG